MLASVSGAAGCTNICLATEVDCFSMRKVLLLSLMTWGRGLRILWEDLLNRISGYMSKERIY